MMGMCLKLRMQGFVFSQFGLRVKPVGLGRVNPIILLVLLAMMIIVAGFGADLDRLKGLNPAVFFALSSLAMIGLYLFRDTAFNFVDKVDFRRQGSRVRSSKSVSIFSYDAVSEVRLKVFQPLDGSFMGFSWVRSELYVKVGNTYRIIAKNGLIRRTKNLGEIWFIRESEKVALELGCKLLVEDWLVGE